MALLCDGCDQVTEYNVWYRDGGEYYYTARKSYHSPVLIRLSDVGSGDASLNVTYMTKNKCHHWWDSTFKIDDLSVPAFYKGLPMTDGCINSYTTASDYFPSYVYSKLILNETVTLQGDIKLYPNNILNPESGTPRQLYK